MSRIGHNSLKQRRNGPMFAIGMSATSSPTSFRLLVVEDDESARFVMAEALRQAGYVVEEAADGADGLERFAAFDPHLVLLDLMMPRVNGWRVLERLRSEGYAGGVIIVASQEDTDTIVRALAQGADDFVPKPCVPRELFARVHAVLRRVRGRPLGLLRVDAAEIDLERRTAEREGQPVSLTATEFKLIEVLAAREGRIVTREELLREVWDYAATANSRTVDTHVWRLRRKLCADPHQPRSILTVPGGYRLLESPAEQAQLVPIA